ncbi:hypothetical protein DXG03_001316 [Asterophora parasitica]|uniref:Uncharacterized protein n=1 Tax=Asterophora parasitica TaxID=117018 RepID=A0A9P7G383_9AGAR|nr:hypothetical protein DXG03_001316 [Asterophora parasitica]
MQNSSFDWRPRHRIFKQALQVLPAFLPILNILHSCAFIEIWKSLCYSVHTLARYSEDEPESWRDHYFFLNAAEEKRLEEASAKLRSQRHEAEERKKEREVKLTDRVPPPKRQRTGWGAPTPKTLFQKTRTEASKMQKTMSQRMLPPMPQNGKRYSVLPKSASAAIDFLPPSSSSSRVTVNNVVHRRPVTSSAASSASIASTPASASSSMPSTIKARPLIAPSKSSPGVMGVSSKPPLRSDAPAPAESRPLKPPAKKDPMASLFVPKRRPNPQRP